MIKLSHINLSDISIDCKSLFDEYFLNNQHEISDFTFTNLFMWRKSYNIKYFIINDYLCIFAQYNNHDPFVFFPLAKSKDNDQLVLVIEELIEYFKQNGNELIIKSLTPNMVDILNKKMPNRFEFTPNRSTYDYVYKCSDLISLEGKKLHAKRNHINRFVENNKYTYYPLTLELIDDCISAATKWCIKRDCDKNPGLAEERAAIVDALNNFEALKFQGGVIKVDNEVIAFTYGERLTDHTAVIHVEKADSDIQGSYAIINQQFCEHQWRDYLYINREEDMGIEGLRKAKMSYQPVRLIEKYRASLIR